MQSGDIITQAEVEYVEALERLWDALSDTVEGGRLTEADIPDDYQAFVVYMERCEVARYRAEEGE